MRIQGLNNYELRFHIKLKRNGFKKANTNPLQYAIAFIEQPYLEVVSFNQTPIQSPIRFIDLSETTLVDVLQVFRYDADTDNWIPWHGYCYLDNNHSWIQENLYANFQGLYPGMELVVSAIIYPYPNNPLKTGLYITYIIEILNAESYALVPCEIRKE